MTINLVLVITKDVDVLVPDVIPVLALLIVEAIVVIVLWGVAGIFGDFYVPVSWSTVYKE